MKPKNTSILIILWLNILTITAIAQGINYPNNAPINNGGVGNARTDADNLFTRNNAAALTEIENVDKIDENLGKWRVMSEFHTTHYRYNREWKPFGFNQTIKSTDSVIVPSGSGEITYTDRKRRYAVGFGISQTFGFESKLKDDDKILGNQAMFFDTRVGSTDFSAAIGFRVKEKVSLGGSFIIGRGYLMQTAPIQQLAVIGIIRNSRLDVSQIGGAGASFNLHYRPSKIVNFGFNFKTARNYELQGTLDSIQPAITAQGLQLFPIKLNVRVPFKLPLIAESGVKIEPSDKIFVAFDYRFYNYSRAFKQLNVIDKTTNTAIATQTINARNVHLLSFGGAYKITPTFKLLFGTGFQNNAISDSAFTPALNNQGGISFSSGVSKKVAGVWMNVGLTTIFSLNRTIPVSPNNTFAGDYKAKGWTIGWGVRW